MLILCGIHDVHPGDVVGAPITHPSTPGLELLKPGVVLEAGMLASVIRFGVAHVWIADDATRDLDGAVAGQLTAAKLEVFNRLKQDLRTVSQQAVSAGQIQSCRQAVLNLVCSLISGGRYAGLTDSLFGCDDQISHATNVAYLSILVGLEVQVYIIKERPRLSAAYARDMGVLGLAGMLHDIGKTRLDRVAAANHEIHAANIGAEITGYDGHTLAGYNMLRHSRGAASVTQAVLNHHQRFDGSGWPDMAAATRNRRSGTQSGRQIHIFTRIVSAANVLDNLLRSAAGSRVPPVSALHTFASARFDGWFDPIIRRATLRRIPPFAIGSQVGLSDGRKAVVVAPNLDEPCRPTVRPLGGPTPAGTSLDLTQCPHLSITHYLGEDIQKWLYGVPTSAAAQVAMDAAVQQAAQGADPQGRRLAA